MIGIGWTASHDLTELAFRNWPDNTVRSFCALPLSFGCRTNNRNENNNKNTNGKKNNNHNENWPRFRFQRSATVNIDVGLFRIGADAAGLVADIKKMDLDCLQLDALSCCTCNQSFRTSHFDRWGVQRFVTYSFLIHFES
jgi:hypothetical protein